MAIARHLSHDPSVEGSHRSEDRVEMVAYCHGRKQVALNSDAVQIPLHEPVASTDIALATKCHHIVPLSSMSLALQSHDHLDVNPNSS